MNNPPTVNLVDNAPLYPGDPTNYTDNVQPANTIDAYQIGLAPTAAVGLELVSASEPYVWALASPTGDIVASGTMQVGQGMSYSVPWNLNDGGTYLFGLETATGDAGQYELNAAAEPPNARLPVPPGSVPTLQPAQQEHAIQQSIQAEESAPAPAPTGTSQDTTSPSSALSDAGALDSPQPVTTQPAVTQPVVQTVPVQVPTYIGQDTTTGQVLVGYGPTFSNDSGDNLVVNASIANAWINGGSGDDILEATGTGTNVLNDSGGTVNFEIGSTAGNNAFFLDASKDTVSWNTIVNMHAGDGAVIYGITAQDITGNAQDGFGAPGVGNLTVETYQNGGAAFVTFTGFSKADLSDGKLAISFGTAPDGRAFLLAVAS